MKETSFARKRKPKRGSAAVATGGAGAAAPLAVRGAGPARRGSPLVAGPALALPAVQRKEQEPATDLQTAPAPRPAAAPPPSPGGAALTAVRSPGVGEPLPAGTRRVLESRLGTPLDAVRLHRDPRDREAARDLRARAFTHGPHVWLGPGESANDLELMAHEAVHVAQQGGEVRRQAVQRAPADPPLPADAATISGQSITIPEISMPGFRSKAQVARPIPRSPERPDDQRDVWTKGVLGSVKSALTTKLKGVPTVPQKGAQFYFVEVGSTQSYLMGPLDALAKSAAIPYWDKGGARQEFDVDHMQEMQVGGKNVAGNMELLNASSNRSSGSKIKNEIRKRIKKAIEPHVDKIKPRPASWPAPTWPTTPDPDTVRAGYDITFTAIKPDLDVKGGGDPYWTRAHIQGGTHLNQLKPLDAAAVDKLRTDETELLLFPTPAGGAPVKLPWGKGVTSQPFTDGTFLPGLLPTSVTFQAGGGGSIAGTYPAKPRKGKGGSIINPAPVTWTLTELPALGFAAYVEQSSILSAIKILKARGLSLVELGEAFVDPGRGVVASGIIKVSLPLLAGSEIDLTLEGGDVTFSKTFTTDELKLKGPVKLNESSLTVFAGTGGLGAEGQIDFEIEKVAKGNLAAVAQVGEELELSGQIDFEAELFEPARVELWYRQGKVGGKGTLGIAEGKVKGIKSASVVVNVDGDNWKADGTVTTDVPGVQKGELSASFDRDKGLEIAGKLTFGEGIPAIKGGSLEAKLEKGGEGGWKVRASGTADLDIPGAATTISATYDDGGVLIKGTVAYQTKLVDGTVTAGASNMPVDRQGNPTGAASGDALTAFGSGSVTLKIAPWLQGTVGLELTPTGEVKVSGEVKLPSALQVFPKKEVEKRLLSIGIDIPIVGVAVAGQKIGIFATIGGSLSAHASIGPGELRELGIRVSYNPSHEEETKVSGGAVFVIPADAGLRLAVNASLGAGIPVVSAKLGLEIGGELGVQGEARASVQVEWTPTQGVKLDAEGKLSAQPKFKFDVTGFALVEADLLVDTVELYSKRWQLAALELGSGLEFGVRFPVHYQEGKPFDISLSDVEFDVPDVDPGALLKNLVSQIA